MVLTCLTCFRRRRNEYRLMEAGMIKEKMPPSNNFTSSVFDVWLKCVLHM